MAGALNSVLPIVTGGLGLLTNAQNANSARGYQNSAANLMNLQAQGIQNYMGAANTYDPARDDQLGFQVANNNAQQNVQQALSNVNARTLASGGQPTGDTAFQGLANNTAMGILGPLAQQQAAQVATESQRKLSALASVFQAPTGQLANQYFNAAAMKAPSAESWGSALNLLSQGINGLFQHAPTSGVSG